MIFIVENKCPAIYETNRAVPVYQIIPCVFLKKTILNGVALIYRAHYMVQKDSEYIFIWKI